MGIRNIIFDIDGVLRKGTSPVPGAAEALSALRGMGMKVFFLTNNGEHTREYFVERLRSLGIGAEVGEMYSSSYGAGRYISENLSGKSVFAFSEGMKEELAKHGIAIDQTERAQVVLASLDTTINYGKLVAASRAIMAGAVFLAANDDANFVSEDGLMVGAGAIVAALSRSSGKGPLLLGKPQPYLLDIIIGEHGLEKGETLMVGDNIDTDILMAKREGLLSALVLSGVSAREDIKRSGIEPDYVLESVAELPSVF